MAYAGDVQLAPFTLTMLVAALLVAQGQAPEVAVKQAMKLYDLVHAELGS